MENIGLKEILLIIVFVEGIVLGIWAKIGLAKKTDIYNQNGTTKFMPAPMCSKTHQEMNEILKEIKADIKAADEKREKSKGEISGCLKKVTEQMSYLSGRFDQWEKSMNG